MAKSLFLLTPILQESNQLILVRDPHPTLQIQPRFQPLIQTIFQKDADVKLSSEDIMHMNIDISIPIPKTGTPTQKIRHITTKLNKKWQHDCFEPLPHQLRLQKRWVTWDKTKPTSTLLYWRYGGGKSLGALCVFTEFSTQRVFIVCGNSLLLQWYSQLTRTYSHPTQRTEFVLLGLQEFVNQIIDNSLLLKDECVIFDECHLLYKRTERMQLQIDALLHAKHLFLLSATPLLRPDDVIAFCQLMRVDISSISSNEAIDWLQLLDPTVAMIDYYDPMLDPKECKKYAPFTVIKKRVPMTWAQTLDYMVHIRSQFQLASFSLCSSTRNSYHAQQKKLANKSNQGDCPKLMECANQVVTFGQYPQLVMIFYLDDGKTIYNKIRQLNPKLRIEYETGSTSNEDRERYRKQSNTNKLDVVILSAIGSYGMDFIGIKATHVFSYEHNEYKNQAQGRGLRYNAHKVNAKTKQLDPVVIFHYISCFPEKKTIPSKLNILFYNNYIKKTQTVNIKSQTSSSKRKHVVTDIKNDLDSTTTWIKEYMPFDFNEIFIAKLEEEENYKTIDENLEITNAQKEHIMQPLLLFLQHFAKQI